MKKYTLGLYEKAMPNFLTWEQKLQVAKEAGYDFIEMSIDETDEKLARLDMSKNERLALIQTMYKVQMPIRSLCLSGHRKYPLGSNNQKLVYKSLEIMEKAIELADDLGIRIIMLAGYDVYYEDSSQHTKERFLKNLKHAVQMASAKGIMLSFETMETEFMNTVSKAMHYVKEIQSPYLTVYPDVGNIKNAALTYDTDVYLDLHTGKSHITAIHLKETVPGKFREIPYGTGHVDFEKMIDQAWNLGIRRFVTEFWYVANDNWREEITNAFNKMNTILMKKL
jgi:L-ribulose-5-phosphate 3-epimerase